MTETTAQPPAKKETYVKGLKTDEQARKQKEKKRLTRQEIRGQRIRLRREQKKINEQFEAVPENAKETWLLENISDPAKSYKDGDLVLLNRDGKPEYFVYRDFDTYFQFEDNSDVRELIKSVSVNVHLSTQGERFQSTNDAMSVITANEDGYPVIQNPGEPAYMYKDQNETPAQACQRFLSEYRLVTSDGNLPQTQVTPGSWIKVVPIRVLPVGFDDVPIAIRPAVDKSELMGVAPGGAVAEKRYLIADTSIKGNLTAKNHNYEYVRN